MAVKKKIESTVNSQMPVQKKGKRIIKFLTHTKKKIHLYSRQLCMKNACTFLSTQMTQSEAKVNILQM